MLDDFLARKAKGELVQEVKKPFMRFLRFKVGDEEFLVDLPIVMEITDLKELYPVPGSSYFLLWSYEFKGQYRYCL